MWPWGWVDIPTLLLCFAALLPPPPLHHQLLLHRIHLGRHHLLELLLLCRYLLLAVHSLVHTVFQNICHVTLTYSHLGFPLCCLKFVTGMLRD